MATEAKRTPARPLHCMEIWGGNQAVEEAVTTPGLDIWVYSRPHEHAVAGGDVYYTSLCGGGSITRLILADVAGHGAAVADIAKSLRALMRSNINRKDQGRLVKSLNREFAALAQMNRFATAVVATYKTKGDTFTVSNAGHPRPLWFQAASGRWSVLAQDAADAQELADLPLGIVPEMDYSRVEVTLGPDDLILFYTDALTEAEDPAGRMLGEDGLLRLVSRLDATAPAAVPAAIVAALAEYRGGPPPDDDLTVVLLHHNSGPSRPPAFREKLAVYAKVFGLKSV
ncbi:PP2C family protein-serine/threonine phosphatase [Limnoglobus roseus]|uniref:CBS domain-containing protein n=1 Tax=Limnoglobus roseus TaxID=2598579 RepID=A0A5C1ALA7_9BACT|nr:PP2C family protein-serine/threonine phosphatase [Limnoglobus roseus]QEL20189.1 CBS domain-containing protein [Limnoglobus roseus]